MSDVGTLKMELDELRRATLAFMIDYTKTHAIPEYWLEPGTAYSILRELLSMESVRPAERPGSNPLPLKLKPAPPPNPPVVVDRVVNNVTGWRGMDSAPKDGSEFVMRYTLQGNAKRLVNWNTIHGFWESKGQAIMNITGCEWHQIDTVLKD